MVTEARRFSPLDDAEQELEAAWRMSQGLETPPAFSGDPLGGLLERERWLQKAVSDAELSACILGCALVRTVGALQFDDRDLHTALEAHRRHRREERTERVAELRAARRDDEARVLEALSEAVLFSRRKSLFGAAG